MIPNKNIVFVLLVLVKGGERTSLSAQPNEWGHWGGCGKQIPQHLKMCIDQGQYRKIPPKKGDFRLISMNAYGWKASQSQFRVQKQFLTDAAPSADVIFIQENEAGAGTMAMQSGGNHHWYVNEKTGIILKNGIKHVMAGKLWEYGADEFKEYGNRGNAVGIISIYGNVTFHSKQIIRISTPKASVFSLQKSPDNANVEFKIKRSNL